MVQRCSARHARCISADRMQVQAHLHCLLKCMMALAEAATQGDQALHLGQRSVGLQLPSSAASNAALHAQINIICRPSCTSAGSSPCSYM